MRRSASPLFAVLLLAVAPSLFAAPTKSDARHVAKTSKPPATYEMTVTDETKAIPAPPIPRDKKQAASDTPAVVAKPSPSPHGNPTESHLTKAPGSGHKFDLRHLPHNKPVARDRIELEPPPPSPAQIGPNPVGDSERGASSLFFRAAPNAPAPPPNAVYDGLDRFNWGAGSPPDTNGDVGPAHYIQTVNTSIGVFRKSDGFMEAAFTFDTFMSQGNFGNLCDTNNFGDPVVLYDTFEDRWIIADFAFQTDGSGNVLAPAYQCIATSLSGDPLAGGWNFYSIRISDFLDDYPKFGIWPDGLYMSANLFTFGAGSSFQGARVWAFNKAQMYAGSPTVKIVSFNVGGGDFTVIPSNARLQAGTPPAGRPNLFVSTWQFLNALTVYKFHVDWNSISSSTFTGPDAPLAATSWPNAAVANVPQSGSSQLLDALQIRAMVQNQYTNFGGVESLWVPHTVRRQNTSGFAAPRWYQVNVNGGTVAANLTQATTWDPDGANVMNRWMPSLALDRAGNMAMGYSTSNGSTFPSIKYAGRLAADPVNTFSLGEQTFFTGTASQLSSTRWGDYSSMTLDPDGCTFWYTSEYATGLDNTVVDPTSFNKRWQTKFGSLGPLPGCTPVGAGGTVSGVVTRVSDASPIVGATVALGARSATTDGSGAYAFPSLPAGTYSTMTASFAGYGSSTSPVISVADGGTTTQNFALANAAPSACLTDTTQGDFLTGVPTNVDLNASPGDVTLSNAPVLDQSNTAGTTTGTGFGTASWGGQTFIPAVTGALLKVDVELFSNTTGTTPNLTLSVRATSAGLPTGADLASANIPGFNNGTANYYTIGFGSPAVLTAGTQYALILRPVATPSVGSYFWIRSSPSTYANGQRVISTDNGVTWTADSTRDFNFRAYMDAGYSSPGSFISSPKDANPSGGITPIWANFSWTATTPANTSVKFQLAGSNDVNGPFTFVGPDGTASTFFTTSPVQLSPQFYGFQYIEYEAFLATTNSAVTPALNDATLCFNDVDCSSTPSAIVPTPPQVCANTTGNTASGPAGMSSYAWGIANGTITSATDTQTITYTAGASGTATLTLTVTAPNGCIASNSIPITINPLPAADITISNLQTVTVTGASGTFALTFAGQTTSALAFNASAAVVQAALNALSSIGGAGGSATVTLSGNVYTVTFGGTLTGPQAQMLAAAGGGATAFVSSAPVCGNSMGNQASGPAGAATYAWTITNGTITSAANVRTITYTAGPSGSNVILNLTVTNLAGCTASSAPADVPIVLPPPTPTVTPSGATTFCAGGSVTLTSSSASGNQWYDGTTLLAGQTNQTYIATSNGNYNVVVTLSGCSSAASADTSVTVNPLPDTPNIAGTLTFCTGGNTTLFSDSSVGNQWFLGGNPIGGATGTNYLATVGGSYTVQVTDGNGCVSAMSAPAVVVVNSPPPTPTISGTTNGTGTQDQACPEVPLTLTATSSGATSFQWYKDVDTLNGETNSTYQATGTATYYVTATVNGCASAKSAGYVVHNPTPHAPFISFRNQPSTTTSLAICQGSSQIIDSDSATGIQWYKDGVAIPGGNNQSYTATQAGVYTAQLDALGCHSQFGRNVTLTVNPLPSTPTITPGGATTFCQGSSVVLTSTSATGYQWKLNGSPIGGATLQSYSATATGSYTVTISDANGCTATSAPTSITVNPTPATPTITPGGPTTFCAGGSVTLTSSSASGNQWYLNAVLINAATSQTYVASVAGDYTVVVTANSCPSAPSAATTVTVNAIPSSTITAPSSVITGSTGNTASVPNAGAGTTYNWSITNGTITAGTGTNAITFTAGAVGPLTLQVTVTRNGCSSNSSANITVAVPPVTVTSVSPSHGSVNGGLPVTISGTGFQSGATVTFGGTTATNIVFVNATTMTAKTPAHAGGAVNVVVTNTNTSGGTLTNGFTYVPQRFDPNGDNTIDPSDIFYLVHWLFTNGPAPTGAAGMMSGDANGDGVVDPSDIFFTVNYLFDGGYAPQSLQPVSDGTAAPLSGSVSLGTPFTRDGRTIVPVILASDSAPRSLSLRLTFDRDVRVESVHRTTALAPSFEIDRTAPRSLAYLVTYGGAAMKSGVVAEIELAKSDEPLAIAIDPALTLLSDGGVHSATVGNGRLTVLGTSIGAADHDKSRDREN